MRAKSTSLHPATWKQRGSPCSARECMQSLNHLLQLVSRTLGMCHSGAMHIVLHKWMYFVFWSELIPFCFTFMAQILILFYPWSVNQCWMRGMWTILCPCSSLWPEWHSTRYFSRFLLREEWPTFHTPELWDSTGDTMKQKYVVLNYWLSFLE